MIGALEEEMRKAAEKMDFEKAAEFRNMVADLRNTTKPMRRFTRGSLPSTIDPMADVKRWPTPFSFAPPSGDGVLSISRTSPLLTSSPRWFVFGMAFRTKIVTAVTGFGRFRARTILPAWPRWSASVFASVT